MKPSAVPHLQVMHEVVDRLRDVRKIGACDVGDDLQARRKRSTRGERVKGCGGGRRSRGVEGEEGHGVSRGKKGKGCGGGDAM